MGMDRCGLLFSWGLRFEREGDTDTLLQETHLFTDQANGKGQRSPLG